MHVELFLPRFSNEENKALNACPNLIDKIDGAPSSILFLLQESVPNTINLVDYKTTCNPVIHGVPLKGIDKKSLFRAAQGLSLQFLNLFGFSISVSFA